MWREHFIDIVRIRVTDFRFAVRAHPHLEEVALGAVTAYRRARTKLDRSVRRAGERAVRAARFFAYAGLYLAVTGALALGFYGALHLRS